mgnify:FL=1
MNTVEGASVLTAIAVTVGLLVAGLSTLATSMAAYSSARDVARMAALGVGGGELTGREGETVEITRKPVGETPWSMVTVRLTKQAPLFDVTVEESILEEPNADSSGS